MWEPYAVLRRLNKPVDLIVLNTDEHVLTNPVIRLASQVGSVDWFRFWLQDYEGCSKPRARSLITAQIDRRGPQFPEGRCAAQATPTIGIERQHSLRLVAAKPKVPPCVATRQVATSTPYIYGRAVSEVIALRLCRLRLKSTARGRPVEGETRDGGPVEVDHLLTVHQ